MSYDEEHSAEVFYESEEDVDCISRYEVHSGRKVGRTIAVVREVVGGDSDVQGQSQSDK